MQKALHFLIFIFALSHDVSLYKEFKIQSHHSFNCSKLKLFKPFYLLMFLTHFQL